MFGLSDSVRITKYYHNWRGRVTTQNIIKSQRVDGKPVIGIFRRPHVPSNRHGLPKRQPNSPVFPHPLGVFCCYRNTSIICKRAIRPNNRLIGIPSDLNQDSSVPIYRESPKRKSVSRGLPRSPHYQHYRSRETRFDPGPCAVRGIPNPHHGSVLRCICCMEMCFPRAFETPMRARFGP